MNYEEFKTAALRKDAIKNDNVHYFSKFLAPLISYIFFKLKFSPNQATLLFLIIGILSSVFLYKLLPILSYIMWRFHIIIDMADGNLARSRQMFSKHAIGFDRSNHIIINTTILLIPLYINNNNFLLANCLLVAFYLYYFFSRNFSDDKSKVNEFSLQKNMIKNIFGLEGYILTHCLLVYFEYFKYIEAACFFYTISFFTLFLIKLANRIIKT